MVSDKLKGKQGISLPLAMAIISVLIILSASLIAIAGTSVMSTSSSVNSRQAYLNVRSALEYAYAYYGNSNNVDDLQTVDGQYMIMDDDWFHNESGGMSGRGARIGTEADAASANTYVTAKYIPASNTGSSAMLKLTAYSKSSDAFGNRSETVHMSAAYVINSGSAKNRVTMTDIDMDTTVLSQNIQRDAIQIHARPYPGQDWTPFYYIWTYKDVSKMYYNNYGDKESTCYDVEKKYKFASRDDPDYPGDTQAEQNAKNAVKKINTNEKNGNKDEPEGVWNLVATDNKHLGPASYFKSSDNGWYQTSFYYDKNDVNYFNLMITKKGKVMSEVYRGGTGMVTADGIQSNEMFHLWFLTSDDKNVYVEFLKDDLKYRMKSDWNGLDELDDRYLIYVMNQKTTVHFKAKGIDDQNVTTTTKNPVITYITVGGSSIFSQSNAYLTQGLSFSRFAASADSNSELWGSKTPYYFSNETVPAGHDKDSFKYMMYEGCGWWVANVPVGVTFAMHVNYYKEGSNTMAGSGLLNVEPNRTTKEAFVVADPSIPGKMLSRRTEASACDWIGVDINSYSTVKYKTSEIGSVTAPRLDYKDGEATRPGRRLLHELIVQVTEDYHPDDYTEDSYNVLLQKIDDGITLYNIYNYLSIQVNDQHRTVEDVDKDYDDAIKAIKDAVKNLVLRGVDNNLKNDLRLLVEQADKIVTDQSKNHAYDTTYFSAFNKDYVEPAEGQDPPTEGAYKYAKKILEELNSNSSTHSNTFVKNVLSNLEDAIKELDDHKLNRAALTEAIEKAKLYKTNTRYDQQSRAYLIFILDASDDDEVEDYMDIVLDELATLSTNTNSAISEYAPNPKKDEIKDKEILKLGAESYKKNETTQAMIDRATMLIEAGVAYVSINASDPELKQALDDLYKEIVKVEKFANTQSNTTRDRLETLVGADGNGGALAAAKTAHESAGSTEALNKAKEDLVNAYENAYILKPDKNFSDNAKTATDLSKENKVRIWFSGFSSNGYIKKVLNENNVWEDVLYKVKGMTMMEYDSKGNALGTSVDSSLLKDVSVSKADESNSDAVDEDFGQNLSYYDFDVSTKKIIIMMELEKYEMQLDSTTGTYVPVAIETTTPFNTQLINTKNSGTVICFDHIFLKNEGQVGPSGNEVIAISNNLATTSGTLSEYYIDAPTGTVLEVYDDNGSKSVYSAIPEGKSDKKYQVVRFVTGVDQKGMARYYDSENNRYINSEEFDITSGKKVIKFDKTAEPGNYTGRSSVAEFNYSVTNNTYGTTQNPVTMSLEALYTDGTTVVSTPINIGGNRYSVSFIHENGVKVRLIHTARFVSGTGTSREVHDIEYTTTYLTVSSSGVFNFNISANGQRLTGNASGTTVMKTLASEVIENSQILVDGKTTSSSASTAASAAVVPGLVSDNIVSSLAAAPLTSSLRYSATFDYFGQQGREVVPVVNTGKTVIWLDENIILNDYSTDGRNKRQVALKDVKMSDGSVPFAIHVWGKNEDLIGTDANHVQMYRVENTCNYYMIVSSEARGCTIVRRDTGRKINNNNSDNNNWYFDATSIWGLGKDYFRSGYSYYQSNRCDYCGRYLYYEPRGSKVNGQGFCEPYIIINQPVYEGYNRYTENVNQSTGAVTYSNKSYYSLSVDYYYDHADGKNSITRTSSYCNHNYYGTVHYQYQYKYRAKHQLKSPTYYVEVDSVDRSSMTATDLRMAFVGGSKLRIVNESYYSTYGAQYNRLKTGGTWASYLDQLKNSSNRVYIGANTSSSSLFGGDGGDSGNNNSDNRIGDARLYIVYDWYEYKIPVDSENTYDIQFSGVQYNASNASKNKIWTDNDYYTDRDRFTAQISGVYGNIWVEMQDTLIGKDDDHRYQHMKVYTQDPELVQVEDTQDIYFEATDGTWNNITVKCTGVGGTTPAQTLTRVSGNLYKITIPASKPFLTFEATYKKADNTTGSFYCQTSLQGGDTILFMPSLNRGTGGWVDYVPNEEAVRRALYAAQTCYCGDGIPTHINSDFKVYSVAGQSSYDFPTALGTNIVNPHFSGDAISDTNISADLVYSWVGAYKDLYNMISKAKAYLGTRDATGKASSYNGRYFQEYYFNNTPDIYDSDTIAELYNVVIKAENVYKSDGGSNYYLTVQEMTEELETAINNVSLSTSGMIAFIYYDTKGYIAEHRQFQIKYKTTKNGPYVSPITVKYTNSDGYPIYFLEKQQQVFDVRFLVDGVEQNELEEATILDGAWVYMDINVEGVASNETGHWVKNSVADYHQVNVSEITSANGANHIYTMKVLPNAIGEKISTATTLEDAQSTSRNYQPITLYFKNDTYVSYKENPLTVKLHFLSSGEQTTEGYADYNAWIWAQNKNNPADKSEGVQYDFDTANVTSTGVVATITVTEDMMNKGKIGFIVRKGTGWGQKVNGQDLFFELDSFKSGTIDVYFKQSQNTTVNRSTTNASTAEGEQKSYTIRAGAYSFVKNEAGVPQLDGDVYVDSNSASYVDCPFVYANPSAGNAKNGAWVIQCDLFSERAKTYFTNPYSYHKLISNTANAYVAVDAESNSMLNNSWLQVNDSTYTINPGSHTGGAMNINLTLNDGGFIAGRRHTYDTSGDLYFRWEGNQPLKVSDTVIFSAKKIVFATSGDLDATKNYNKHFYFTSPDSSATSMTVEFVTDVHVMYYDVYKELHDFTIREGEYIIHKENDSNSYICDLCDEKYWTTLEYVEVQNRYNAEGGFNGGTGGGTGRLSDPIYG